MPAKKQLTRFIATSILIRLTGCGGGGSVSFPPPQGGFTNANLNGSRAHTVSFDRPYLDQGAQDGAGNFMVWDYPMVRWLA